MTENGSQESGVRSQKSEVRGQRTEETREERLFRQLVAAGMMPSDASQVIERAAAAGQAIPTAADVERDAEEAVSLAGIENSRQWFMYTAMRRGRTRRLARLLEARERLPIKHAGPGPHPGTGTPQSVHGQGGEDAQGLVSTQETREGLTQTSTEDNTSAEAEAARLRVLEIGERYDGQLTEAEKRRDDLFAQVARGGVTDATISEWIQVEQECKALKDRVRDEVAEVWAVDENAKGFFEYEHGKPGWFDDTASKDALTFFNRLTSAGVLDFPDNARISLRFIRGRAAYDPNLRLIYFSPDAPSSTFVHEIGHWLEDNSGFVRDRSRTFYRQRTEGEGTSWLGERYRTDEYTKRDKWIDPYVGRWYADNEGRQTATELASMGLQYLYADPFRLAKEDPWYFRWLYDTLRGTR